MRLIDADALLKSMHDYWGENPADTRMVNAAPTVDAVPVVRCRECKFWLNDGIHITGRCGNLNIGGLKLDSDFCSYGERKDEK